MADLPTGTRVPFGRFLFTDVEGSTRLWEQQPAAMRQALVRHDAIIEDEVGRQAGVVVRPRGEGDSRFAVFARATDAVAAAVAIQRALHDEPWPVSAPLRVRLALHTGEADLREGDYYGSAVNRCARLRAVAHGGQVLVSQATYDLVLDGLGPDLRLIDLGAHRLQDLQRSERVFQLLAPGITTDFSPLRSLDMLPNNLPLQMTSFVGREQEVEDVKRLLGQARLVTLTGPGGSGKTRLALHVAAEMLDSYADGVWLVELAGVPVYNRDLALRAIATSLDVHPDGTGALQDLLVGSLRSQQLLLLLDNCEHLVEAVAAFADTVLHLCPGVRLLATSREPLAVLGERPWPVLPLAAPAPGQHRSLSGLNDYAAIRLFVERAGSAAPSFRLSESNATAVAELCHHLDGLPLAIELAAARVRVLSVEQLLERIADRFRLLARGSRSGLPRQQTLQALIDWSYDLLTEQERLLFNRLSVFEGRWTIEDAEAVCAATGDPIEPEEVLDLLTNLVDKSLIAAVPAPDDMTHYRMLETLRAYAHQRLTASGEAVVIERRFDARYLVLAQRAEVHSASGRTRKQDALSREAVQVDGATLEVFVGPANGPWIATTHPFLLQTADAGWMDQISRVVKINARGLGNSTPIQTARDLTLDQLVEDVEAVRRCLAIERWIYRGGSAGGTLGLLYALRYPQTLSALIVGSCGFSGPWVHHVLLRLLQNVRGYSGQRRQSALEEMGTLDLNDRLGEIRVPTLVFGGRCDPYVPIEHVARLHEAIHGSEFVVFEESGHNPANDEPEKYRTMMERFLARCAAFPSG